MGIDWNKIGAILGSKAFENAAGVAGAGLSAYGASKDNATNAKQSAAQFAARMALESQNSQQSNRLGSAQAAAAASPLGANENFAAKQALMRSILPGLRNQRSTPSDPGVASAMGTRTGGLRLPEGGLPASALAHYSPEATAGAIAQRQNHITNIDPNAPGVNFQRMGFDPSVAGGVQGETNGYQSEALRRKQALDAETANQLKMALEQNYAAAQGDPEQKKSGGFLSKLGGVLKFAAPIAASFIPGVGPIAAAAIGGLGSGAGAAMQGGGVGGALKAGAVGAGAGAAGNAALQRPGPQMNNQMGRAAVPSGYQLPRAQFPAQVQRPGGNGVNASVLAQALRRGQFGG